MYERFTDRARRVIVLAQEEARVRNHNYLGTEHILLAIIHEGEGVAVRVLESLGISLDAVRQQVEGIIGQGQQAPPAHIPFTPRAKKVLELSLREAVQLRHAYIGTEHILLGLIREGDGVAAQVLVKLGADPDRVRQQVIHLLREHQAEKPGQGPSAEPRLGSLRTVQARLEAVEQRLAAIERQIASGPGTGDLDEQIEAVRAENEAAIEAQQHELAAALRNLVRELLAGQAARPEQRAAGDAALPDLAERCQQLAEEVERLRALLREHGVDPQDKPGSGRLPLAADRKRRRPPAAQNCQVRGTDKTDLTGESGFARLPVPAWPLPRAHTVDGSSLACPDGFCLAGALGGRPGAQ